MHDCHSLSQALSLQHLWASSVSAVPQVHNLPYRLLVLDDGCSVAIRPGQDVMVKCVCSSMSAAQAFAASYAYTDQTSGHSIPFRGLEATYSTPSLSTAALMTGAV